MKMDIIEVEIDDQLIETITPVKSPSDSNEYRILRLRNGLRALLISTPLNADEIAGNLSGPYTEEGPHFLRHGATARARNLASEVFGIGNDDENDLEDSNSMEVERHQIQESEDDSDEAMQNFINLIAEGDPQALEKLMVEEQIQEILKEKKGDDETDTEEEFPLSTVFTPVSLGYEIIPADLADVEISKDEASKLVFPDSQPKSAKNGAVSITIPFGALSDHLSIIGIADLSRQIIQNHLIVSVQTGFETTMSTFTHLCEINDDIDSQIHRMAVALNGPAENNINKKISALLQSNYPYCNSTCTIKNRLDGDSWMLNDMKQLHLLYSLAKDDHPFKAVSPNFYLGLTKQNTKIPKSELKDNLQNVWKNNYHANGASIVVQSSETLECLQKILLERVGKGSRVEIETTANQKVLEPPFDMKTFAKLYKVVYTGVDKVEPSLVMSWALSPKFWKNYKSKPMDYVSSLINHKSEGGLFATLYDRGWITDIQAHCNHTGYHRNDYISLFQIKIVLTKLAINTEGGLRTIVKTVFSYFNFLKTIRVQPQVYDALHYSRQVIFHSSEQESSALRNVQIPFSHPACPFPKISVLGEMMQMIPHENLVDLLTMDTFYESSDADVDNLLTNLDLNTCNFMLSIETFRMEPNIKEVYYGTKYIVKDLPQRWKQVDEEDKNLAANFSIPITWYKSIEKSLSQGPLMFDDDDLVPVLVLKNQHVNVWKKCSSNFKKVSAYIMHFATSLLNTYSPNRAVMIAILSKKLNDQVVKEFDSLKLISIHYSIEPTHIGVLVKIFGHQNQSTQALKFIFDRYNVLMSQKSVDSQIKPIVQKLKRNYKTALGRPEILTRCVYNTFSVRNYVPLMSKLDVLEDFSDSLYNNEISLFQQSSSTGMLALGCCSHLDMLELAEKLPEMGSEEVLTILGKPRIYSFMWPVGYNIIRVVNNYMEKDSFHTSQHFQLQTATPETKAFANILLEIVKKEIIMSRNLRHQMLFDARVNEFNNVVSFELIGSASNTNADGLEESLNDLMGIVHRSIGSKGNYDYMTATCSLAITHSSGKSHQCVSNEFHEHERKIKDFSFSFNDILLEGQIYGLVECTAFRKWFSDNFVKEKKKLSIQIVPMPNEPVVSKTGSQKSQSNQANDTISSAGYILVKPGVTHPQSKRFVKDIEEFKKKWNYF